MNEESTSYQDWPGERYVVESERTHDMNRTESASMDDIESSYIVCREGKTFGVETGVIARFDARDPLTLKVCADRLGVSLSALVDVVKTIKPKGAVLFVTDTERLFWPFGTL